MALAVPWPLLLVPEPTAQQADPTAEPAPLARGYRNSDPSRRLGAFMVARMARLR